MARRKDLEEQHVSLFPMFNILVCTLGVLVFLLCAIVALSLGIDKTVLITTEQGNARVNQKTPTFIEWNGADLILYPDKQTVHLEGLNEIRTYKDTYLYIDDKIEGTPFQETIDDIRFNGDSKYIILLIRPSGFEGFVNIRGYIEHKEITIGYEPISQKQKFNVN